MTVIMNPQAPGPAAERLLAKSGLLAKSRQALLKPLTRYLASHENCLTLDDKPNEDWPESALREHEAGRPVYRFRLRQKVSVEIERDFKRMRSAERDSGDDRQAVRMAARNATRTAEGGRANWAGLRSALIGFKSVQVSEGRKRAKETPVVPEWSCQGAADKSWVRVTNRSALSDTGRQLGLCVADGRTQAADYARALMNGTAFYSLLGTDGRPRALLSVSGEGDVLEAKARGNKLCVGYRLSIRLLLAALDARANDSHDLLAIGIADGFDASLKEPNRSFLGYDLWRGTEQAILIRKDDKFNVLRRFTEGYRSTGFDVDMDDLGAVLLLNILSDESD